ncbi:MAG TPA: cytochrome P450 [Acidimicrobiales bacterium]|nr:cytochrome P450 [Acidimicrobiales bacterium]
MPSHDLYWDPYDTELDSAPHDVWRRMRDEQPVYRNDDLDFWAFSRFVDVEAAHKDPATFSSAHGTVLEVMSGGDMASTGMMIFLDPPDHTMLRSLVSRAFTPRRVTVLEDHIRELCAGFLDPMVGGGGFDYVQEFGAQLPSRVISALLGVPEEDQEAQRHVIDQVFHIEPGVGMMNDVALTAQIALNEYLAELVDRRVADPQDDMITALAQAEVTENGVTRRLGRTECVLFANLLFSAGTETVGRLLGNAAVVLHDFPDERAALVEDPSLIPNAVEELLRFEAPSPVQGRWTTRDIEVQGVAIPADSKVLLLTGSAGRDERVYPDPDRFDVRRKMDHHLSFGYGIHFCVGAALARMEGRIALEETLKRFPAWGLDPDHVVRQHTSTVRGYSEVRVLV